MLTFDKFTGINNVLPTERLKPTELTTALNVDIGLTGEITRRSGYTVEDAACHKNLHQSDGYMLATCNGDLKRVGGAVLYPSLGVSRVWYCNLPDGRTTFSNGLINGITDGATATDWGVPVPESLGAVTSVAGDLFPGEYQYSLTYVRLSDGLEGGPLYSNPVPLTEGGIFLSGLPQRTGYRINVYLTSHNGDEGYLAGTTATGVFSFIGKNDALVLPCRTNNLRPMPAGTVTAFWRGRVLVAQGNLLLASRSHQHELHDPRRDFKQFEKPITLIQPVDDGIYIGTEDELVFLAGTEFDNLQLVRVMRGRVVIGSGVSVPGKSIKLGEGAGQGAAMICIVGGYLVAGFGGGTAIKLTEGKYVTSATEVAATFREINGVPQYLAIPQ